MDVGTFTDRLYVFVLLAFNGVAFVVICACYAKMYASIRGGREAVAPAARSDMTVAKRMALLVFTDFACWAPVAFFGLTALAGYPLIDVPKTKIVLVFFYPLNSCANPYLYALLTQQYRRDLFVLLSRFGVCNRRADEYKGAGGPGQCGGVGRRRKNHHHRRRYNDPRHRDDRGDRRGDDDPGGLGSEHGLSAGGRGCGGDGIGGGCGGVRGDGDGGIGGGGDNHHRGSVMTTVTSVDSVVTGRPGSLTPLQEQLQLHNDYGYNAMSYRPSSPPSPPSPPPPPLPTSSPSPPSSQPFQPAVLTPQHLELLPLRSATSAADA